VQDDTNTRIHLIKHLSCIPRYSIRLLQPLEHDRPDKQPGSHNPKRRRNHRLRGHKCCRIVRNNNNRRNSSHKQRQGHRRQCRRRECRRGLHETEQAELLGLGKEAEPLDGGQCEAEALGFGQQPGIFDSAEDLPLLELLDDVDGEVFAALGEEAGAEPLLLPLVVVAVHLLFGGHGENLELFGL